MHYIGCIIIIALTWAIYELINASMAHEERDDTPSAELWSAVGGQIEALTQLELRVERLEKRYASEDSNTAEA